MPIRTETGSTTSGGTTTVGAVIKDDGPGGLPRYVDVYLHIESAKLVQAAAPVGATVVDKDRLSVWWMDKLLPGLGSFKVHYALHPRLGNAFEGGSTGTLTVVDRSTKEMVVQRFCLCPRKRSDLPGKLGASTSKTARGSRTTAKKAKKVARKPAAKRSTSRR